MALRVLNFHSSCLNPFPLLTLMMVLVVTMMTMVLVVTMMMKRENVISGVIHISMMIYATSNL